MTIINISKKSKIIVSIIGVVLTVIGYYLSVYASFGYGSKNDTYGDVLVVVSIAIIQMMWLDLNRFSNKVQVGFIAFIGIGVIIGSGILRGNHLNEELAKNGLHTKATVVGFEVDNSERRQRTYAQLQYKYKNQSVLQRIWNFEDKYKLNQTLNILISSEKPYMFKIVEK